MPQKAYDGSSPQITLSSFMGGDEVNTRAAENEVENNMTEDTLRAKVLAEISDEYKEVWNRLSFIKDDHARARATNNILMSKDLPPRELPPEVAQAVAERKEETESKHRVGSFNFRENSWDHCPECGTKDIKQTSAKGRPYTACTRKCDIFLNDKGVVRPMDEKKAAYRIKPDWTVESLEAQ